MVVVYMAALWGTLMTCLVVNYVLSVNHHFAYNPATKSIHPSTPFICKPAGARTPSSNKALPSFLNVQSVQPASAMKQVCEKRPVPRPDYNFPRRFLSLGSVSTPSASRRLISIPSFLSRSVSFMTQYLESSKGPQRSENPVSRRDEERKTGRWRLGKGPSPTGYCDCLT